MHKFGVQVFGVLGFVGYLMFGNYRVFSREGDLILLAYGFFPKKQNILTELLVRYHKLVDGQSYRWLKPKCLFFKNVALFPWI